MTPIKHDETKTPWALLPFDAVEAVVEVLRFGAKKYGDRNWEQGEGFLYSRLYSAAMRHLTAWWGGQDADPETGCSHLAHAACCILFLLAYRLRGQHESDDRPRYKRG